MPVTELKLDSVVPFEGGRVFGEVGRYELVRARATILLDPDSPRNQTITDIRLAERTGAGLLALASDVAIVRPQAPERGNGCLVAVVPNRGRTSALPFTFSPPVEVGVEAPLVGGDAWLLKQGYTVAWAGWQFDVARTGSALGCAVPSVVDLDGRPVAGTVRVEVQAPLVVAADLPLLSTTEFTGGPVPYPAADTEQTDAVMRWKHGRTKPPHVVPREEWAFARDVNGTAAPDPTRVWLKGGFHPDRFYEVCYRTAVCPMVGGGLAAFREVMSYLRHQSGGIDRAVAVGWSQSGRFLREYLFSGLNLDDAGRQVFDVMIPFIAGASRGEFNQRYGQPGEVFAPGLGHAEPFDLGRLLARQRAVGGLPAVMIVNSASEYWRADGSLGHIALDGRTDVPEPPGARQYLVAGTDHVGGQVSQFAVPGVPSNHLLAMPFNRAFLELARAWMVDGEEPPPSRVPRMADGTAVSRESVLTKVVQSTGVPTPAADLLATRHHLDGGPAAPQGLPTYPIGVGPAYPAFVSAVDSDGNETAGVRHPELTVPLATHTGWNNLLAQGSQWEVISLLTGNSHPFPATPADRNEGDSRPSIAERYTDRADYLTQVEAVAKELVTERFLLTADIERIVTAAGEHYDLLASVRANG